MAQLRLDSVLVVFHYNREPPSILGVIIATPAKDQRRSSKGPPKATPKEYDKMMLLSVWLFLRFRYHCIVFCVAISLVARFQK